MSASQEPADLPNRWDPDYEPIRAELQEVIAPPEGVERELLRRFLLPQAESRACAVLA